MVGTNSGKGVAAAPFEETNLLGFISAGEVGERVASFENKTAPGWGKVKKTYLKPKPVQLMMLALYNFCVLTRSTPSE